MSSDRIGPPPAGGLPLVQEQLDVGTRTVQTDRVQVRIRTRETEQSVQVPLKEERIHVERVPIGRRVDETQPIRQEGDVTIVPVYEETLVVTRQLVLKEEIRLTRLTTERLSEPQHHALRQEHVDIARDHGTQVP